MSKIRQIWNTIEKNCQGVALAEGLVQEGETFALTPGQEVALSTLQSMLQQGKRRLLLKAPTGSGKTEVLMRLGAWRHISSARPIIIIAPTRDLCRQHLEYLEKRLKGTPLAGVALIHGGMAPNKRDETVRGAVEGRIAFVVASAMIIANHRYRELWDAAELLIVDDVNAFDEDEHLRHIKRFPGQALYLSATPEAVRSFLHSDGAWENMVEMTHMPFDTRPTRVSRIDVGNYHPKMQLEMVMDNIRDHIAKESRIYIISRLKREVPRMAAWLRENVEAPVYFLHGDMSDTQEHRKRHRRKPGGIRTKELRIDMMTDFRNEYPSILVATNLVGSGLDIPMADCMIVTDAHTFSPAEIEQLIGRVGRRERDSEAFLLEGDSPAKEKELKAQVKFSTRPTAGGGMRYSFAPRGAKRGRRR